VALAVVAMELTQAHMMVLLQPLILAVVVEAVTPVTAPVALVVPVLLS
jgi:hypothetical protein